MLRMKSMTWRCLFALLVLAFVAPTLRASEDDLKPSEVKIRDAVQAVISQQLAAFRADDYAKAYGFADEAIKGQFPLEAFERMVRMGYPAIAHSASVSFGLTLDNGDMAVVNARVVGKDEKSFSYQYILHRDGANWRITGVVLVEENKSLEV